MKKTVLAILAICAVSVNAADIGRVIVRQQWPWSTNINVEFELSGVSASAPADVSLRCYNGETEIPAAIVEAALSGTRCGLTEGGTYTVSLDPAVLFAAGTKTVPDFRVTVAASATSAADNEVIYKIIDLATGDTTNLRRADFYNHPEIYGTYETDYHSVFGGSTTLSDVFIWTGVTNNPDYVSKKLVLRKIPAAGAEWSFGSATSKITAHLTADFWIGVFPLTQAQYNVLKGSYGGAFTDDATYPNHARYPVCGVAWRDYRTSGTHPAFALIAERANLTVDFPTEMQWEYAALAGASDGRWGLPISKVAWYKGTTYPGNDPTATSSTSLNPMPVGLKLPNPFGLYDLVGNIREMCRDWYAELEGETEQEFTDYAGPESGTYRVNRGGYFNSSSVVTCYARDDTTKVSSGTQYEGTRVWAIEQ